MPARKLAPFLITLVIMLFFAHLVVYDMLVTAWPVLTIHNGWTLFFVLTVFSSSFVLTSILVFHTTNKVARFLYKISAYWVGLLFYFLLATAIWSVTILIWPREGALLVSWFCLLALLIGLWGIINAKIIREKLYKMSLPNLPEAWRDKKVVMISDLHLGAIKGKHFAYRVVARLEKLKPDIIFICGDFFDGVAEDEEDLAKIFSSLKPKNGVYVVTGNHDGFVTSLREIQALKQAGLHVLENEIVVIDGVQILGVDHRDTSKKADFHNILARLSINRTVPSILLKHTPTDLDEAERVGINLVLSGHTHNGQVTPTNLITELIYKGFNYGLKKLGSLIVITSSGVGTWGPPLRVGTHSEIVTIRFVHSS